MRLDRPEVLQSPELRRLFAYWWDRHAEDRPPSRAEIDPVDVPDLLPDLLLVDVDWTGDKPRFYFRLAGTRFTQFYTEELTGRWLDDLQLGSWQSFWEAEYHAIIHEWKPRYGLNSVVWQGRDFVRFEWLMLPLVTPNRRCDMILIGVRFEGSDGFQLQSESPEDTRAVGMTKPDDG
ncbi:PAS domain-containing protein [Algihabitans albus]|uniref:PAS domain-containing protein n=1 Tax=Algihabitans albus TaxID=2164067 RepID=UPI000E5C6189|nr:PAS domain-containing protein [Algihabitans albus]